MLTLAIILLLGMITFYSVLYWRDTDEAKEVKEVKRLAELGIIKQGEHILVGKPRPLNKASEPRLLDEHELEIYRSMGVYPDLTANLVPEKKKPINEIKTGEVILDKKSKRAIEVLQNPPKLQTINSETIKYIQVPISGYTSGILSKGELFNALVERLNIHPELLSLVRKELPQEYLTDFDRDLQLLNIEIIMSTTNGKRLFKPSLELLAAIASYSFDTKDQEPKDFPQPETVKEEQTFDYDQVILDHFSDDEKNQLLFKEKFCVPKYFSSSLQYFAKEATKNEMKSFSEIVFMSFNIIPVNELVSMPLDDLLLIRDYFHLFIQDLKVLLLSKKIKSRSYNSASLIVDRQSFLDYLNKLKEKKE